MLPKSREAMHGHSGRGQTGGGTEVSAKVSIPRRTGRLGAGAGVVGRGPYLVAGRVLTRVKNTDGSTSTCSPSDRLL